MYPGAEKLLWGIFAIQKRLEMVSPQDTSENSSYLSPLDNLDAELNSKSTYSQRRIFL